MCPVSDTQTLSPTVVRIVSVLKNRIVSGAYKAHEWLPTERSLAEEFNVSRILIRAAIKELERNRLVVCSANRRPLVQFEAASAKKAPASRSLSLWIWPNPSWPGSAVIIQGIQEVLSHEWRLVLGSPVGDTWSEMYASEARFLQKIRRDHDVEGVVLGYMGGITNLPQLEVLRAARIPMVFIDHAPPAGFEADYVGVNNKRGMEQIVKHLVALGHRRIAHVSNFDELSTVAERLAGYQRALQVAGIPFRPELIRRDPGPPGDDSRVGCEELLEELLDLPESPTAICAVNDVVAYRLIAALRARGLRVPEDISVTGFDGIEQWTPGLPFLTTVYQPFDCIGAQAMDLLLERIKAGPDAPYKHVILDVRLSIQQSTRKIS